MSTAFWIAVLVMVVLAVGFLAAPLIRGNRRPELIGLAVALPLFAAAMYWLLGSPKIAGTSTHEVAQPQRVQSATGQTEKSVGSVASMVDGLAARLQEEPDDGKSWLLLAQSYEHLDRIPEAIEAYGKAVALGEYNEALESLVEPDGSEIPSSAAQIFGKLELSARTLEIVKPTDTVFIFARAIDGPAMPLAVLRRPASDLPLDFLLNDSQAMSADLKLSDFEEVIVTARVSRSGVASEALQDLEARSNPITIADNRHLNLIIE